MDSPPVPAGLTCDSLDGFDGTQEQLCAFVRSQCPSDTLIDYQMILICYFSDDWKIKLLGLALCCFLALPFWLILLSDIADAFVSPVMGLLSQSIPYLSPRLAGVTFLAIGNGAPDLSSNSNAIASGAVHLSAGALTGAAMFVQCIVASEVIRLSEGVAISPSQMRDMFIYMLSIVMVLFFFTIGQFTFTFVSLAILIYLVFVINVALGGFSAALFFPSWFGQQRSEEQARLLEDGDDIEGERVARGDTIRFNWAEYRDQILQLQLENEEAQEDVEVQAPPAPPQDIAEMEEEEGDDFASFSEVPDFAPPKLLPSFLQPSTKASLSSPLTPGRRVHFSFIGPGPSPLMIPSSPFQPSGLPSATPMSLRRHQTIGNRPSTHGAASAVKPYAHSKLIDTRAYKLAVLADRVSADPFHLENTVAPITQVQAAEDGQAQVLPLGPRQFLQTFSRIDTIGRDRALSSNGLGTQRSLRAGDPSLQSSEPSFSSRSPSMASRSRSMASSSMNRSNSSRMSKISISPFFPSTDSPTYIRRNSSKILPSRLAKIDDVLPSPTPTEPDTDHLSPSQSPPPLSIPLVYPGENLDEELSPPLSRRFSALWNYFAELLEVVLFEVTAGASEEWSDGNNLSRLMRMIFLPLLLPCYLLLRTTLPLLDPHSYRPKWLLLSIIGAPVAAYLFLFSPSPTDEGLTADEGSTYGRNLFIVFALGLTLSILCALTITRNNTSIPTLLFFGGDLAPSLFSLAAFFVGLLYVNLVAGEVVGILSLLASVLKIPPSVVGMTLLAWGNSLSDLAGNTALAVGGLSSMALTACTAGPLFNMMLSMALGFSRLLADGQTLSGSKTRGDVIEEPGVINVKLSADIVVACIFLVGINAAQILTVLLKSKQSPNGAALPKNFYLFSRAWYALYLLVAVTAATLL